jgi:hypothetical protein
MVVKKDDKTTGKTPPAADTLLAAPFPDVKPATKTQIAAARADTKFQKNLSQITGQSQHDSDEEKELTIFDLEWNQFVLSQLFSGNAEDMTWRTQDEKGEPIIKYMAKNGLDPKDGIDRAFAEFQQANPRDREITSRYESHFVPQYSVDHPVYSVAPSAGFKPPAFTMSKTEARAKLAADIVTVSGMYAADAGMSKEDFAKVLGGVAVIESSFGVIREVKGTKHPSSAGGPLHYLDGTIAGKTREKMISDPRIASRVDALGINVKDGVSKAEAWGLKDDNILAGSVLANDLVKLVKQNPHLKGDVAALTARLYQTHNMGDAGARALAQGGIQAVNRIDHRIAENNPMFFRGASSTDEVQSRYTSFTAKAVGAATPLLEDAMMASDPSYALAKNAIDKAKKGPAPVTVADAVKQLPTPQPS